MKIRIKLQGFLMFLALAVSLFLSKIIFPHWKQAGLDEFLDSIGVSIVLFGFLIRIVARGLKEEKSQNGHKLVRDGIYSLVRHPMYFGTLLIGLGIILILYKWWVFPLFFCIFLMIYIPQTNREEKLLAEKFGDEYKDYCRRTPRYFPNLINLFKIDFANYLSFKWLWLRKEILSVVAVFIALIGIEAWEDAKLFGDIEYKKELLELLLIIAFFVIFFRLFYKQKQLN